MQAQLTTFERALAFVSPSTAFARARARLSTDMMLRSYDAAKRDVRNNGWLTAGSSANSTIAGAEASVRENVRHLARNNGYAVRALSTLMNNIIGTGIMVSFKNNGARLDKSANRAWKNWCEVADYEGHLDLYGLQNLAVRTWLESGMALVRYHRLSPAEAAGTVPLRLQILEPDFIDGSRYGNIDGRIVDRGLVYDQKGRHIGYYLFDHHPGNMASYQRSSLRSSYFSLSEVRPLFQKLRPGQDRGVSILAPAVLPLNDIVQYFSAEMMRKRIESCLAAFITSDEAEVSLGSEISKDSFGVTKEKFTPGMIFRMKPGEDVKINSPAATSGVAEFVREQLRAAAAGAGIMYEHLTGDLSMVNYSSYRAGNLEFRRMVQQLQYLTVIPMLCVPIVQAFEQAALVSGHLTKTGFEKSYTPPRHESIDPEKDAKADLLRARNGLESLSSLAAEQGYEFGDLVEQIAADLALADSFKLSFDSDPRRQLKSAAATPEQQGAKDA
jgi:lambda family phage portal protein